MDRRNFLKRCAAVGAGGYLLSNKSVDVNVKHKRPLNIVFLMIDDMGQRDVGFMGSDYYETPKIDKLAGQGMVFTDAYANAANCAPTRACFLTGQYGPRHGVFTVGDPARGSSSDHRVIPIANDTTLDSHHVTMAELLGPAGYVSINIGKWHMGNDPELGPIGQGFDENDGGNETGGPKGGYFSPWNNPELPSGPDGEYLTDRLTDEAVDFIERHQDRPFFLYLPHYAVHTPIQGKEDLIAKYQDKPPSNGQDNPTYAAMVDSVDQSVGRIMAKLEELDLVENTVVFFFSDNGGHSGATSNFPLRGFKGTFYEGGIREPMIVRWPGVTRAGSTCNEPVIGIDFFPTMLEIAGVTKPADKLLDGVSILPLLKGADSLGREAIFWHFPCYLQNQVVGARDPKFRTRPVGVIRKGNFKLMQFFEEWVLDGGWDARETNNAIELYDLGSDPYETTNLANTNPAKRDELLNMLIAWQTSVNAPIPNEANPAYIPS